MGSSFNFLLFLFFSSCHFPSFSISSSFIFFSLGCKLDFSHNFSFVMSLSLLFCHFCTFESVYFCFFSRLDALFCRLFSIRHSFSYSLETTMMCFPIDRQDYIICFSTYPVKLFNKAYHRITSKRDLNIK